MASESNPSGASQKQRWKSDPSPTYYSNVAAVGLTPFDVTIIFGEVERANATEVLCAPKAKLILSPEQASNLIQMLTKGLSTYSAQFGQLRSASLAGVASLSDEPSVEIDEG